MAISEYAGIGSPVCLPRTTSNGLRREYRRRNRIPICPTAYDWRRSSEQRIIAEADRDRKWLALVEIFLPHDAAMLAGRHVERERIAVMDHDAIAAEVDPTFVEIARDDQIAVPI